MTGMATPDQRGKHGHQCRVRRRNRASEELARNRIGGGLRVDQAHGQGERAAGACSAASPRRQQQQLGHLTPSPHYSYRRRLDSNGISMESRPHHSCPSPRVFLLKNTRGDVFCSLNFSWYNKISPIRRRLQVSHEQHAHHRRGLQPSGPGLLRGVGRQEGKQVCQ